MVQVQVQVVAVAVVMIRCRGVAGGAVEVLEQRLQQQAVRRNP